MDGTLSINRTTDGKIVITLQNDERTLFLETALTAEAFGQAVTGLSDRPCEYRIWEAESTKTK